jgi:hypothetical protein
MNFRPRLNVFLSYARADSERVSKLHHELERAGFDAWMDRSDIVAGDWRTAIKRGLRRSNFFLACLSTNTVTRGEVLEFEWDSALDVQQQQLEGELYLIPVRLEPCDVPEKLRHLQWIDLFAPDGEARLLRVLGSKGPGRQRWASVVMTAGLLLLAGITATWWFTRDSFAHSFVDSRPGGTSYGARTGQFMLGITLWKLRETQSSDPAHARYLLQPPAAATKASDSPVSYTPIRLAPSTLRMKDRVFLTVESSRSGYLYVVDRELHEDGSTGAPLLIFPTARVSGGENQVTAGRALDVPDRFSNPNYFEASGGASYAGERLTFFVAPAPVAEIRLQPEATLVAEDLVRGWERQWASGVKQVSQDSSETVSTVAEAKAMNQGSTLGVNDPAPQMIYSARRKPQERLAVVLTLAASH